MEENLWRSLVFVTTTNLAAFFFKSIQIESHLSFFENHKFSNPTLSLFIFSLKTITVCYNTLVLAFLPLNQKSFQVKLKGMSFWLDDFARFSWPASSTTKLKSPEHLFKDFRDSALASQTENKKIIWRAN